MPELNKVFLMGNCTRDVELKYTAGGLAIADLGLAVNRKWRDKQGGDKEETLFCDITVFGRQAETTAEYLRKGSAAFIEGRLKTDSWDDKTTGKKRTKLTVVAERVQFLGGRDGGVKQALAAQNAGREAGSDDDSNPIPF